VTSSLGTDAAAKPAPALLRGTIATLRHARYTITENPVSGVAFTLFLVV
jgi:hypothetical protein